MDSDTKVRNLAARFLARREYCRKELIEKLIAKGAQRPVAENCVDQLVQVDLVSDVRFAKSLIEVRIRKGYGPLRIADELRKRGVEADLISSCMDQSDAHWNNKLSELIMRKYGDSPIENFKQWAKRANFLRYRGFTSEQIQQTLGQYRGDA